MPIFTPRGIREKSLLTHSFIDRKREEFDALKAEIEALEEEADYRSCVHIFTRKQK